MTDVATREPRAWGPAATEGDDGRGGGIVAPTGERAQELIRRYRSAQPFRHVVLDDLVPHDMAIAAFDEERRRLADLDRTCGVRSSKSTAYGGFGPAAAAILAGLESPEMVAFFEQLSGIEGLQADPTHFWAGLHANHPGDHHLLHRDFVRHPATWLWHRLNVLIYLNPVWPQEWGGGLELWARGGREAAVEVAPVAPTVVIFEITRDAVHGLPNPVACPDGTARLSLATYFYTKASGRRLYHPLLSRPRRPQDPWRLGIATPGEVREGLEMRAKDGARAVYHALRDHTAR